MKRQELPLAEADAPDAFVVHAGAEGGRAAVRAGAELRGAGFVTLVGESGRSFKAQLRRANGSGARFAVIIGEDEAERGVAALKDLRGEGEQEDVPLDDLAARVGERLG